MNKLMNNFLNLVKNRKKKSKDLLIIINYISNILLSNQLFTLKPKIFWCFKSSS